MPQNIIYCLINTNRVVRYRDKIPFNFEKAITELKNLDWTYEDNGISILNMGNGDGLFCKRQEVDKWLFLTPVRNYGVYEGYQWASYPNLESLVKTVKLF